MRMPQVVDRVPRAFDSRGNVTRADQIPQWVNQLFDPPDLPELEGSVIEVIEVDGVQLGQGNAPSVRDRASVQDVTVDAPSPRPASEPTADSIRRPKQMWD